MSRRMDAGFARVDADIRELRRELHAQGAELRADLDTLRFTMLQIGGGMVVGFLSVIAAVLVGS